MHAIVVSETSVVPVDGSGPVLVDGSGPVLVDEGSVEVSASVVLVTTSVALPTSVVPLVGSGAVVGSSEVVPGVVPVVPGVRPEVIGSVIPPVLLVPSSPQAGSNAQEVRVRARRWRMDLLRARSPRAAQAGARGPADRPAPDVTAG
jgi:hypothetical protein